MSRLFLNVLHKMSTPIQPPEDAEPSTNWVDLTYQEALDHISWIQDPNTEDDTLIYYLNLVDSTFPGGNVDDLIFHPDQWFNDEAMLDVEFSAEELTHYLMAWTGKRLVGAEAVDLPPIPGSKRYDSPAVITL